MTYSVLLGNCYRTHFSGVHCFALRRFPLDALADRAHFRGLGPTRIPFVTATLTGEYG